MTDDPPIMDLQTERPEQGKFSKEETNFLKTYLPAYEALCHELGKQATGPRGTGSVKGCKKDWIHSKVFSEFVKQFSSDQNGGPQLQSLQAKILRWFANHSPHRSSGTGSKALTTGSPKRPRAVNGADVFSKDHKAKITKQMAEQQDQEGGTPNQVNLARYRTIKRDLYNQLPDEERRAYEAKAAEQNEERKALPEKSKIFENQKDIIDGVVKALHNLVGWDWGQYGEAIFFVQGAYRDADFDLKTFNVSVAPTRNANEVTGFASVLPDYKRVFRAPFREWAEIALPVRSSQEATDIAADQKYLIDLQEDGHPRFPVIDIDLVAPNDARLMLKTYIELTWKFTIKSAFVQELDSGAFPWDLLETAPLRKKLLVNPEAFSQVKTLDPMRMPLQDVYTILAQLLKGQNSGVRLLEFSIKDLFNSNTNDMDTEQEINDPPIASPRGVSIDSATAEPDNDISELLDSDLPIQVPLSPAKCTASKPLSNSVIKAAIEKVAEAGHLNISDVPAIDSPNQALQHSKAASQQSGEKTGNSKSKKRRREEQDGPNEGRKTKKQVVPTREQSSRLKDANYRNKNVTVRPR